MSDQPILQIRDLCKDFKVRSAKLFEGSKQLHALSHVNLDIQKGETLGVIGEPVAANRPWGVVLSDFIR